MDPRAALARIVAAGPRAACSDGERRAACWARDELRAHGRDARLETFWVRPSREAVYSLHAALVVAGSITSVWEAGVGLAILGAALLSLGGELTGRARLLRLLWPLRATQNVVAPGPAGDPERVRLVVTANLDAGRGAAASSERWTLGRPRRLLRDALPGGLALLWGATALLCLLAGLRLNGHSPGGLAVLQFALTVVAVIAFAALIDGALAEVSPGANVNASGAAVAISLAQELDRTGLRALDVEVVLSGAGDRQALGFERYIRSRQRRLRREQIVVLAVEPCGGGTPGWFERAGLLLPLRMHPRLCQLMTSAAASERQLGARPYRPWAASAAYAARRSGWPAIAIGALDADGRAPRAHQAADVPDAIDDAVLDATLELGLAFVGLLDAELAATHSVAAAATAPTSTS
jgi:hypothetical protein